MPRTSFQFEISEGNLENLARVFFERSRPCCVRTEPTDSINFRFLKSPSDFSERTSPSLFNQIDPQGRAQLAICNSLSNSIVMVSDSRGVKLQSAHRSAATVPAKPSHQAPQSQTSPIFLNHRVEEEQKPILLDHTKPSNWQ